MKTKAEFIEAAAAAGFSAYAATIEPHLLPAIKLICKAIPSGGLAVGQSRIGGLPDLPAGMSWPTAAGYDRKSPDRPDPLLFLAQINLADAAAYDADNLLPCTGLLLFFAATWVNALSYQEISDGLWKVIYIEDLFTLKPALAPELPQGLLEDEEYSFKAPEGHVFKPVALEFSIEITMAQYFDHPALQDIKSTDEGNEAYWELSEQFYAQHRDRNLPPNQTLLGHAQLDQNYSEYEDSILLLQLKTDTRSPKTDDASDLYWEFAGRGCFFIRPEALKARDFSDIELVYEV